MASLSGSFTGTGQTSTVLLLRSLTSAGYTLGAFASGSVYLERTVDGGLSWQVVATHTAVVSAGYYENEFKAQDVYLRLRSASATTIAWTLADNTGEALAETVVNDNHGNLRYYVDDQGFFRANGFKDFAGLAIVTGGISSLNGDEAETQTFAAGTSGSDFAVSTAAGVHTFNLPNAGASARGVVSTGAQSFAGVKTFLSAPIMDSLTASRVPYLDGSKALAASSVTSTELGYLSGVTSAIQTQFTAKAPLASPTFTTSARFSYGTASTVPYFDSNKDLISSAVTPTELGYLTGVTSAIQTQLGTKAPTASPAFTTQVTFGNYHLEPSEQDAGNSGTTDTIDLSLGSAIKSTLTGNVTYTLSNPVTGGTYVFRILTGAGSFTVTWPATVKWSLDQGAYVATTTASRMDLVSLYWDGTNYYGSYVKGFTP